MPNVPSFRRIPARAIDPIRGASTWALGSQTCKGYVGVFTSKAIIWQNNNKELLVSQIVGTGEMRDTDPAFIMTPMAIRRGVLLKMVYITR